MTDTARTALADRIANGRWPLLLGAFLAPIIAVLAPLGLAPLAGLCGLGALIWIIRSGRWKGLVRTPVLIALAILLVWAVTTLLWSPQPAAGLERLCRVTLMILAGLCLMMAGREASGVTATRVQLALVLGLVIALALVTLDLATDSGVRRLIQGSDAALGPSSLNRAATVIVLLMAPAVLAARRSAGPWVAVALIILAPIVPLEAESDSALLALAVAVMTAVIALAAPRRTAQVLAVVIPLGALAAPLMPFTLLDPARLATPSVGLPSPAVHRLYIWRFTAEHIAERPWTGHGFSASRHLEGGDRPLTELDPSLAGTDYSAMPLLPLHPHDGPLQIWLELGLPGALALAAVIFLLFQYGGRLAEDRAAAATVMATAMAAITIGALSYGVWQGWWIGALALAAATTLTVARPQSPR